MTLIANVERPNPVRLQAVALMRAKPPTGRIGHHLDNAEVVLGLSTMFHPDTVPVESTVAKWRQEQRRSDVAARKAGKMHITPVVSMAEITADRSGGGTYEKRAADFAERHRQLVPLSHI